MYDEGKIEAELERLNLDPIDRGRYWYIRCPTHDDGNKSAQCFKDGWIHCHAGCPRRHINSLVGTEVVPYQAGEVSTENIQKATGDYTDFWLSLPPLTRDVKGVDFHTLNRLGWKEYEGGAGYQGGVFIPYFNTRRNRVVFFQIRHPEGSERRFTFARGVQPVAYGMECLCQMEKWFVFTEGSRDSVILRRAGVPAVALPSASSGSILRRMANYAKDNGLVLVAASDRDEAGDRLLSNLKTPYIDARTPYGKDVGELYEKYGLEGVKQIYDKYRSNKSEFNEDPTDNHQEKGLPSGTDSQEPKGLIIR